MGLLHGGPLFAKRKGGGCARPRRCRRAGSGGGYPKRGWRCQKLRPRTPTARVIWARLGSNRSARDISERVSPAEPWVREPLITAGTHPVRKRGRAKSAACGRKRPQAATTDTNLTPGPAVIKRPWAASIGRPDGATYYALRQANRRHPLPEGRCRLTDQENAATGGGR